MGSLTESRERCLHQQWTSTSPFQENGNGNMKSEKQMSVWLLGFFFSLKISFLPFKADLHSGFWVPDKLIK